MRECFLTWNPRGGGGGACECVRVPSFVLLPLPYMLRLQAAVRSPIPTPKLSLLRPFSPDSTRMHCIVGEDWGGGGAAAGAAWLQLPFPFCVCAGWIDEKEGRREGVNQLSVDEEKGDFFLSSVSLSPPSLFCAPEIKEEERGGEKEEG